LGGGELHHYGVAFAADNRVLDVRQNGGLPGVVRFSGEFDVHLEYVSVQLFHETDRFLRGELQRLEERGDFGQDALEGGEGFAFLKVLIAMPLLFLVRLAVAPVAVAPVVPAVAVAAILPAYSVPVTAR
jgi:hypothetical protein